MIPKHTGIAKPTRILSRAVERVEEEIISMLSTYLENQGWRTSSLIHDEIVIRHSNRSLNPNDEMSTLERTTKLQLRNIEDFKGWPPGTLQITIHRL